MAPTAQAAGHTGHTIPGSIQRIVDEFQSVSDPKQRYKLLVKYAKKLPALDASHKVSTNRVMGCTSEVWMTATLDGSNRVQFAGDSDSELTRGFCAVLVQSMSGLKPEEVLQVRSCNTIDCSQAMAHSIAVCVEASFGRKDNMHATVWLSCTLQGCGCMSVTHCMLSLCCSC